MIKKYLADNVPEFFFRFDTNQPFEKCTMCGEALNGKKHVIEKVFKNNKSLNIKEILYEYAVCFDCTGQMQGDISEESMQSMIRIMNEHKHQFIMKLEYLHETEKYDVASWIETCSFTGKPIHLCEEYTVSAIIEDDKLVFEQAPIAVSETFMELIQENLSKETKDSFNGLRDKINDDSPSIEDIINTPVIGIL